MQMRLFCTSRSARSPSADGLADRGLSAGLVQEVLMSDLAQAHDAQLDSQ
jgi:hypothetical protein